MTPRSKSPNSNGSDDLNVKKVEMPSFPPPFESGGAAYDFHAASGMFYESIADFFYDPKTKLYYSNKEKIYYTYRPGEDPPFCALAAAPTSDQASAITAETLGPKPEEKKKIAISLKTTVLRGESTAKPKAVKTLKKAKAAPTQPKRKDAANMEAWTELGKEIRDDSTSTQNVPMTITNKPVCLLCKRKFPSIEKLKKHEELSVLHKENVQKKKKEDEAKKASVEYRDRALERRLMHGPENAVALLPVDVDASRPPKIDIVHPEDNLGDSNIGNQMLQKLGWKSGSSLGRGTSGAEDEMAKVQSTLVKDWQKIESLAASGQHDRKGPSSRGGGIGS